MGRDRDELSKRRAKPLPKHAEEVPPPASTEPEIEPVLRVDRDASSPDVLDLRAVERDAAAIARDKAAEARENDRTEVTDGERATVDRMLAARDRAAAALD